MTATAIDFKAVVERAARRRRFGDAARQARLDLGMSIEDLAVEAACSVHQADEVECGESQAPGIMRRICEVLGVEASDIEAAP